MTSDVAFDGLSVVGYSELLAEVEAAAGRSQALGLGWDALNGLIQELAGSDAAGWIAPEHVLWFLTDVKVSGFGGILNDAEALEVSFPAEPGVTVLYGQNGSGKSSLSSAVATALYCGNPPPVFEPAGGGKAPIWMPVPRHRDVKASSIEVTLESSGSRLKFQCTLEDGAAPACRVEVHRNDGTSESIELGQDWVSKLVAHSPVFSYADWERRLRVAKDLQAYFQGLLALGGCFTSVEESLEKARADSDTAKGNIDAAWKASLAQLLEVDRRIASKPIQKYEDWELPGFGEDINDWLERKGLTALASGAPITADDVKELRAAKDLLVAADTELSSAQRLPTERLLQSLMDLQSSAAQVSDVVTTCPVCGQESDNWRDHLDQAIEGLRHLRALLTSCAEALDTFSRRVGTLREVAVATESEEMEGWERLHELISRFDYLVRTYGTRDHSHVFPAAMEIARWLDSSEATSFIECAQNIRSLEAVAAAERTKAVAGFQAVWSQHAEQASGSAKWQEAKKCLDRVRKTFADRRSKQLEQLTQDQVAALMEDAGLAVSKISVSKTKADLVLEDASGKPVTLGMLSAGQRNAILLAPLLAVAGRGPFGFAVLDDPVHAFDEMRVDRLVKRVAELSKSRRVIVMTHDERVREHIVGTVPDAEIRMVTRDDASHVVTVESSGSIWGDLLKDAEQLLALDTSPSGIKTQTGVIIRGLCRQGLDNAIREFAISAGHANGAHPNRGCRSRGLNPPVSSSALAM